MLAGFTDVTGITASTYKLINHTKQVTDFELRENQFNIQVIAIALNKMTEKWRM